MKPVWNATVVCFGVVGVVVVGGKKDVSDC